MYFVKAYPVVLETIGRAGKKEKANRNGCWGWYYDMPSPQLWINDTLWSVTSVSA